jgi:hypothetical protein
MVGAVQARDRRARRWLARDRVRPQPFRPRPHVSSRQLSDPRFDRTTAAGRTALEREPVHIADVLADPEYAYAGAAAPPDDLGVPVMLEHDLIGVVEAVVLFVRLFSLGNDPGPDFLRRH